MTTTARIWKGRCGTEALHYWPLRCHACSALSGDRRPWSCPTAVAPVSFNQPAPGFSQVRLPIQSGEEKRRAEWRARDRRIGAEAEKKTSMHACIRPYVLLFPCRVPVLVVLHPFDGACVGADENMQDAFPFPSSGSR